MCVLKSVSDRQFLPRLAAVLTLTAASVIGPALAAPGAGRTDALPGTGCQPVSRRGRRAAGGWQSRAQAGCDPRRLGVSGRRAGRAPARPARGSRVCGPPPAHPGTGIAARRLDGPRAERCQHGQFRRRNQSGGHDGHLDHNAGDGERDAAGGPHRSAGHGTGGPRISAAMSPCRMARASPRSPPVPDELSHAGRRRQIAAAGHHGSWRHHRHARHGTVAGRDADVWLAGTRDTGCDQRRQRSRHR